MAKSEKFERFAVANSTLDLERVSFDEVLAFRNPIIFDTNFLFVTFQFNVDLIAEIENVVGASYSLFIYEGTIGELMSVERKKDKNKRFLPLIVTMLKRYGFKIISSDIRYIDEQILSNVNRGVLVATNDKELKLKLWERGSRVMYLRQRAYLEIK
jgi:rRNA-processing protein FCF1